MSKFQVGQTVYLFNSISLQVESDEVYGILHLPVAVEGVQQDSNKSIADRVAEGQMVVKEQYQLARHQGVLDAECLFANQKDLYDFFKEYFK